MGTRQTRLLSPTPAALASLTGRLVQLILIDGEVLRGVLETDVPDSTMRLSINLRVSRREPVRVVAVATVREVFADLDANQ